MPRTLENTEVHHFTVSKYTVAFAITPDGHHHSASAETPDAARAELVAWLATLPEPAEAAP